MCNFPNVDRRTAASVLTMTPGLGDMGTERRMDLWRMATCEDSERNGSTASALKHFLSSGLPHHIHLPPGIFGSEDGEGRGIVYSHHVFP